MTEIVHVLITISLNLWGSVLEPTQGYLAGFDTICNDPRKSTNHICVILQKDWSQLKLIVIVNKTKFNPIYAQCGTHHTLTHITQLIKLGHHIHSLTKIVKFHNFN